MGQFRASRCPLCGSEDNGRWTCLVCTRLVGVHRSLLRNLQQWRSLYESQEISDVIISDSHSYSLWDVFAFYEARKVLPDRQGLSIQYCLYENMKERDAAIRMGIRETNPVSTYATIGITSLLTRAIEGDLPGYTISVNEPKRDLAYA